MAQHEVARESTWLELVCRLTSVGISAAQCLQALFDITSKLLFLYMWSLFLDYFFNSFLALLYSPVS